MAIKPTRCPWVQETSIYVRYHDEEWGVPVHDDHTLFEFLILEGMQAGLSWLTILRKREAFREAFDSFDPARVARYGDGEVNLLLQNKGIIRNRLKIRSAIQNAKAFLEVQKLFGSFDRYLWDFVGGRPKINHWRVLADLPATSIESEALSTDLKKREFSFVGSTICYAMMQAIGMVNDHTMDCFRHAELMNAR